MPTVSGRHCLLAASVSVRVVADCSCDCGRLLNPEGSYALVLDEKALRADGGFNYSLGLM